MLDVLKGFEKVDATKVRDIEISSVLQGDELGFTALN